MTAFPGGHAGGKNGSVFLHPDTIRTDAGGNTLTGGKGLDWSWFNPLATTPNQVFTNRQLNEITSTV